MKLSTLVSVSLDFSSCYICPEKCNSFLCYLQLSDHHQHLKKFNAKPVLRFVQADLVKTLISRKIS